jgi:hypothetical protein
MTNGKLADRERRWIWLFSGLVILITTLPYLLGFQMEGEAWRFTGFVFGVEDGNSYLAKMLRGAAGEWLFHSPFSSQDHRGMVAYLPYLILGKLAAPPAQHEQLIILYHLFRIGASIALIFTIYEFTACFISQIYLRKWAVTLAVLGGGLGWVLILMGKTSWLGSLPLEFYSPETFGFLAIYGIPHLAMSRALLFKGFTIFLKQQDRLVGVRAGGYWLAMGLAMPMNVVLAWTILGGYMLVFALMILINQREDWTWETWKHWLSQAVIAGLISMPIVIYTVMMIQTNPFWRVWSSQIITLSPPPGHYLLAYGIMLPFAITSVVKGSQNREQSLWFLITWSLLLPFLIYVPYSLQRRLAEGGWVALVVLAVKALDCQKRKRIQSLRWVWVLAFPSTIILLAGSFQAVQNPTRPIYRPAEETKAFQYLAQRANRDEVVLSSYQTGNALPAWVPVHVVLGHGPETYRSEEMQEDVQHFYRPDLTGEERITFLRAYQVDYLFWGPLERALGGWDPGESDYLIPLYDQEGYFIYDVRLESEQGMNDEKKP